VQEIQEKTFVDFFLCKVGHGNALALVFTLQELFLSGVTFIQQF